MASLKISSVLLLSLLLALAACKGEEAEQTAPADEEAAEAGDEPAEAEAEAEAEAHTYTVRGRVEVLPTEDQNKIQIFHEKVADFVNQKGEVSEMASMSMPFGVADDVSLEGIEEGDVVEFTFEVDWDHPDVSRVTAIDKLPEDTELELQ